MKSLKLNIFLIFFAGITLNYAQNAGIGTSAPHPSAALDINSKTKGTLIPRVNLIHNKDVATILTPAVGLFVYNLQDTPTGTTLPSGASKVTKNTFYFWNGVSWVENSNIDTARNILVPRTFEISQNDTQNTTDNTGTGGINLGDVIVKFDDDATNANLMLTINDPIATGSSTKIIDLTNNIFTVNYPGTNNFEISGYINYNPNAVAGPVDIEFVIQKLISGVWTDIAKSDMVYGESTRANSRTVNIAPKIVSMAAGEQFRTLIRKTTAKPHGGSNATPATLYVPSNMNFSKALRLVLIS